MIHQGALQWCSTPRGETEDLPLFVFPSAHCVTALDGCHRDVTIPCLYYGDVSGSQA